MNPQQRRFLDTADRLRLRLLPLRKSDAVLRLRAVTSSLLFQPEVGFGFIRHAERASSRAIDDQHAARDSFSPYPGGGVVGFEREWAQTFASTMARTHAARERVEFGLLAVVRCLQASGDLLAQLVNTSVLTRPLEEGRCDLKSVAKRLVPYPAIAASLASFYGSNEYIYVDDASNVSKHRSLLPHSTSIRASIDHPSNVTTNTITAFPFVPRNGECARSHLPCTVDALEDRWLTLVVLGESVMRELISHFGSDLVSDLPVD